MTLEADAAQHNHFGITFDFLESFLQEFDWVLGVADKKLFERACHELEFRSSPPVLDHRRPIE
jgi:hypothetical protein